MAQWKGEAAEQRALRTGGAAQGPLSTVSLWVDGALAAKAEGVERPPQPAEGARVGQHLDGQLG